MGRYEDAVNIKARGRALDGIPPQKIAEVKRMLLDALRAGGARAYWLKIIELSRTHSEDDGHEPTNAELASLYAYAGDYDKAIEYLNRTIDNTEDPLLAIKVAPEFEPIQKDPRFIQILKRLNYQ